MSVESLVPKGGEVHTFDPTPSDVRNVAEADLVFVNGLGLDDWLVELVTNAGPDAPVIRLAEDLAGVAYLTGSEGDEAVNPHLWLNVAYAAKYAERIREGLRPPIPTTPRTTRRGAPRTRRCSRTSTRRPARRSAPSPRRTAR